MKTKFWSITSVAALVLLLVSMLGLTLMISDSQTLAVQVPSPTQDKQEGIAYVSWWHGQYESAASDESLAKLEKTGAEWISLLVTWYQDTITNPQWIHSIKNSVIIGFFATILATFFGTLAAWGLSRPQTPFRVPLMGLLISPMIVPRSSPPPACFFSIPKSAWPRRIRGSSWPTPPWAFRLWSSR